MAIYDPTILTPCPICGEKLLHVGLGGLLVCANHKCKEPDLSRAIKRMATEARIDEIAAFFRKFEQFDSIGSTPSDLIGPETWLEGEPEDFMDYFDGRLVELNKELSA